MPLDVRHWSLQEMVEAFEFSLDEYLFFGGYPGAALAAWRYRGMAPVRRVRDHRTRLADGTSWRLAEVDKPALMRQLVDLVPAYSGQIVTYNHLVGRLRDAGNATTIGHYLDLLSDAGIVTQLSNHSGSAMRRSGSSPKLNMLNTGLMTALSGYSFEAARADRTFWGRIVESAVGAHLHSTLEPGMHLSYWRDHPNEVDFVLSQGPNVLGIEVKSGRGAGPTRRDDRVRAAVPASPNTAGRRETRRPSGRIPGSTGHRLAGGGHRESGRPANRDGCRTRGWRIRCGRCTPPTAPFLWPTFGPQGRMCCLGDPGAGKSTAFETEDGSGSGQRTCHRPTIHRTVSRARHPEWNAGDPLHRRA